MCGSKPCKYLSVPVSTAELLRETLRTKTLRLDPLALALEAFEPRFEAADPNVPVGVGPQATSTSFDREGISLLF